MTCVGNRATRLVGPFGPRSHLVGLRDHGRRSRVSSWCRPLRSSRGCRSGRMKTRATSPDGERRWSVRRRRDGRERCCSRGRRRRSCMRDRRSPRSWRVRQSEVQLPACLAPEAREMAAMDLVGRSRGLLPEAIGLWANEVLLVTSSGWADVLDLRASPWRGANQGTRGGFRPRGRYVLGAETSRGGVPGVWYGIRSPRVLLRREYNAVRPWRSVSCSW